MSGKKSYSPAFLNPVKNRKTVRTETRTSAEPKVKSFEEALSLLEDVTEYLTLENLTKESNNLSRVLS